VTTVRLSTPHSIPDRDLESLAEVLAGFDALRGRVRPDFARPGGDQMGGAVDALIVAVGQGGALSALAAGIALWLRNRRPGRSLSVDLKLPDGSRLTVSGEGIDDPAAVVSAAVRPWVGEP
jgi:hypothetical protein